MLTFKTFLVAAVLVLTACATTGSTFGSGVGDAMLAEPPWYAGTPVERVARDSGAIAHTAIVFQRGASQAAVFDPAADAGSPIDSMITAMNRWLDAAGVSRRVAGSGLSGAAPDVRFGCLTEFGVPGNDCAARGDSALGRGRQSMQLSVGRPSREWVATLDDAADPAVAHVLVITLEVGQYLVRQEGWRGTKRVALGTGHDIGLPWLTSLETPVMVLQVTGALVDRSGRAIRIGAEGFHAVRTPLPISALRAQSLLSDDDVRSALQAKRTDLAGEPLAWQVALQQLVQHLTGRRPGQ